MSFRSSINQRAVPNIIPVQSVSVLTPTATSGTYYASPITLPAGTYSASLSNSFTVGSGTGTITPTSVIFGISTSATGIANLPNFAGAQCATVAPIGNGSTYPAGGFIWTGRSVIFTLSAQTTIYLVQQGTFVTGGVQTLAVNSYATIVPLISS